MRHTELRASVNNGRGTQVVSIRERGHLRTSVRWHDPFWGSGPAEDQVEHLDFEAAIEKWTAKLGETVTLRREGDGVVTRVDIA